VPSPLVPGGFEASRRQRRPHGTVSIEPARLVRRSGDALPRNPQDRPRIVFLSQWFGDAPNTGIVHSTVDALRRVGPTVVVSGAPIRTASRTPAGAWPWWRRGLQHVGDQRVSRYPFVPGHDPSTVKRVMMYTSFAGSSLLSVAPVLRHADAAVVYGSPVTAANAALAARIRYGVPFVLIVQDVWPDSVFAAGFMTKGVRSRVAHRLLDSYTQRVYQQASAIVVISEGMRELLLSRGVPEEKLHVIYNWGDEPRYRTPVVPRERGAGEPLKIMYAGSMGPPQGLDVALRALALLPKDRFQLTFVGGGIDEENLKRLAAQLDLTNATFLGGRTSEEMPETLAAAHVHYVSLRDHPLFSVTMPSKLQALLLAGLPIVAGLTGEPGATVERSGAGWVCPPGDVAALARTLEHIESLPMSELRARGEAGRRYYFEQMAREVGFERLAQTVRSVIVDS
jgi:colanic acid biosynthesis glycosyl transferase WcaI